MDSKEPQSAKHRSDASRYPIEIIQSWGAASARHTSGCVVHPPRRPDHPGPTDKDPSSEFIFDAPLGPSVVRWDVVAQTRRLQFQAHYDLVTCMRLSPGGDYIATSCYSGEVKLWSAPQWECLAVAMAPMASQHHVSVGAQFALLCSATELFVVSCFVRLIPKNCISKSKFRVLPRRR